MRLILVLALAFLAATPATEAQQAPAPQPQPQAQQPPRCDTIPVRRQFDFWIGTWDVYAWADTHATGQKLGVNIIAPIEAHCALLESWTDGNGITGRSFNWYDTNLGNWRQLWIAQGGGTLDYTQGEFRDGAMRFSGWTRGPAGRRIEQKLTFFAIHPDTVRQLFEASRDSGRTWAPNFDGRYIRRR